VKPCFKFSGLTFWFILLLNFVFPNSGYGGVSLLTSPEQINIKLLENQKALITETRYLDLKEGINEVYLKYPGMRVIPDCFSINFVETPEKIRFIRSSVSLKDPFSCSWIFYSQVEGKRLTEISYLVEGLVRSYSYIGEIDKEGDLILLRGSLLLDNQTGANFRGVTLIGEKQGRWNIDLDSGQKKKLPLFDGLSFSLQKAYLVDRENYGNRVIFKYRFINESQNILSPGKIRVYQREPERLTFLGEDEIGIVNPGERIEIVVGTVRDIRVERKMVEFSRINLRRDDAGHLEVYDTREKYEIYLKNRKKEKVRIVVREYIPDSWEMINSEPAGYVKEDAHHIRFEIDLEPGEEKKISYQIYRRNLLPGEPVKPLL